MNSSEPKAPMISNLKTSLLIFIVSLLINSPIAYSQFHYANSYCLNKTGNYTINSTYQKNIHALLPNLTNQASHSNFGNHSIGEGVDKVYMLYNCRGDLNSKQCHDCVNEASQTIIERCPSERESILWYEECMVRYANRNIFALEEESPFVWDYSSGDDPNPKLAQIVSENIGGLIQQAAYNKTTGGYVVGQTKVAQLDDIYFLVQCTPDILGTRCERCLLAAFRSMAGCCGTSKSSLMMFFPSCHIRYDRAPVVLNSEDSIPSSSLPESASPPTNALESISPPPTTGGCESRFTRYYQDLIIISLLIFIGIGSIV